MEKPLLRVQRLFGSLLPIAVALATTILILAMAGRLETGIRDLDALAYALLLVTGLSLAFYRKWPVAVVLASFSSHFTYMLLGYPDGLEFVAVLIVLLVVTQQGKWRWTVPAAVISATLLLAGDMLGGPGLEGDTAPAVISMTTAVLLGLWLRTRRDLIAEARQRVEQAERTNEEEAKRRVDEERLRIAREVHDTVAHSIATINVQAGTAVHVLDKRPEQALEALVAIKQASAEAMRELRSTLGMLRSEEDSSRSPSPRLAQIGDLVRMAEDAGLAAKLEIRGKACDLPSSIDLAAYRIIQESVTNVIRHAGAGTVNISITYGTELELRIEDDGRGPATTPPTTGNGIRGMRERIAILGGTLHVGRGQEGGFIVRATLPYEESG
jgi:signal transduction histidine kinase